MIGYMSFRAICTVFAVLSTVGCSDRPTAKVAVLHLRYLATGLDQENFPLAFALKVSNDGDAPAVVDWPYPDLCTSLSKRIWSGTAGLLE